MDEVKMQQMLDVHLAQIRAATAEHADRISAAMHEVANGMRDSARAIDEGPRERWRQNLAASIQLTMLQEQFKTPNLDLTIETIAALAVKHADALIAAVEKKA